MPFYAGIDFHSSNSYLGVVDADRRRVLRKKARNKLDEIGHALAYMFKEKSGLRFGVDRTCRVQHIEIIAADPPRVFDDAVRRTLPSWRFSPGLDQGRVIEAWVITVVRFRLDG